VVFFILALVVPTVLPGLIGTPAPPSSSSDLPVGGGGESQDSTTAEGQGEPEQRRVLDVGTAAPDFSLQDTAGETVSLESLAGKPVVVAFFAPWCPHCQEEAPRLNQIHAQYGDRVHIVSISATPFGKDYGQTKSRIAPHPRITIDDLKWFKDEFGVTYPLLFDPSIGVGTSYQIRSFPTTYFLDADHRVVEVFEGGRPVADFQKVLDGILGDQ
jgi:peroxiredoxin